MCSENIYECDSNSDNSDCNDNKINKEDADISSVQEMQNDEEFYNILSTNQYDLKLLQTMHDDKIKTKSFECIGFVSSYNDIEAIKCISLNENDKLKCFNVKK